MTSLNMRLKLLVLSIGIAFAHPAYAEAPTEEKPAAEAPKADTPAPDMTQQAAPADSADQGKPVAQAEQGNESGEEKSELFQTYMAVMTELSSAMDPKDTQASLDALSKFDFSAETKQKLKKLFGNDHPLHITQSQQDDGVTNVDVLVDPLHYSDADSKLVSDWSGLNVRIVLDKSLTKSDVSGKSDSLTVSDPAGLSFNAHGLTLHSSLQQSSDKLWLGTISTNVDNVITGGDDNSPYHTQVNGISMNVSMSAKGSAADIEYGVAAQSVNWANETVGPIHFDFGFNHIDKQSLIAFQSASRQLNKEQLSPEERTRRSVDLFTDFAMNVITKGASFDLHAFSVQYRGHEAKLTGHITSPTPRKGAHPSFAQVMQKATAKFDLQVPVAFAEDVAASAMKTMSPAAQDLDEEQLHVMAANLVKKGIADMSKSHYVRLDHGVIRSTVEAKAGKVLVNGHPFNFAIPNMGHLRVKKSTKSEK